MRRTSRRRRAAWPQKLKRPARISPAGRNTFISRSAHRYYASAVDRVKGELVRALSLLHGAIDRTHERVSTEGLQ
jgi:hypothetical protein